MRYRGVKGLFLKNWYLSMNKPEKFFDITIWPVIDLLLWAFVAMFIDQTNAGANLYATFIGSIFLWMIFIRCSTDSAAYFLEDFWARSLHNLFVSPVTEGELYVATGLFAALRAAATTVFLLLVSVLVLHFNLFTIDVIMIPLLYVPLLLFGWAIGFFISGLVLRHGEGVGTFTWLLPWFIQPISCVFYPVSSLPWWLQDIANANPLTHVFEGLRAVIAGQSATHDMMLAYVGSTLLFLLCVWYFIASVRASKRSGLMARS